MNKIKKQEYTTPKIKVVSFLIERGFAGTDLTTDKPNSVESSDIGTQTFNNTTWGSGEEGYF